MCPLATPHFEREQPEVCVVGARDQTLRAGCVFVSFRVVLLLLSSGYIGLRIVALEEQLTSLGALPEFSLQAG